MFNIFRTLAMGSAPVPLALLKRVAMEKRTRLLIFMASKRLLKHEEVILHTPDRIQWDQGPKDPKGPSSGGSNQISKTPNLDAPKRCGNKNKNKKTITITIIGTK